MTFITLPKSEGQGKVEVKLGRLDHLVEHYRLLRRMSGFKPAGTKNDRVDPSPTTHCHPSGSGSPVSPRQLHALAYLTQPSHQRPFLGYPVAGLRIFEAYITFLRLFL